MSVKKLHIKKNRSTDLPKEIIANILAKLPAKTIFRSKTVCKEFYDIISDPKFAELHYQNPHLSLVSLGKNPKNITNQCNHIFMMIEGYKSAKRVDYKFESSVFADLDDFMYNYEVVNSCRGILLLRKESRNDDKDKLEHFYSSLAICNPITNDFQWLKDPELASKNTSLWGLGFSTRTQQYKVVSLVNIHGGTTKHIKVLTLGSSDNKWRTAKQGDFDLKIRSWNNPPLGLNGVLYWLATGERITCFDIDKEEFYYIPSPSGDKKILGIGLLHGLLGIGITDVGNCRSGLELWVMKEYGVQDSWCKCYVIESLLNGQIKKSDPWLDFKFAEDCESGIIVFLFKSTSSCRLMTYDPRQNCLKRKKVCGVNSEMNVQFYVPSFLSDL